MLHYETIEKSTLELLNQLQNTAIFSNLRLVGGTSLALQLGHRKSVDLDLFGAIAENDIDINSELAKYGNLTQLKSSKNIRIYLIDGIKVDIVNYKYPWLHDEIIADNIRLAHKQDIAAMKIAAITGRGSRKDFIDIYFLLKEFTLESMLEAYSRKYDDGSIFMAMKSLIYFEDAEDDPMPVMLKPVNWDEVRNTILSTHQEFVNR